jgi:hypothetical protein
MMGVLHGLTGRAELLDLIGIPVCSLLSCPVIKPANLQNQPFGPNMSRGTMMCTHNMPGHAQWNTNFAITVQLSIEKLKAFRPFLVILNF